MNESLKLENLVDTFATLVADKVGQKINVPQPQKEQGEQFLNTQEALKFLKVKSAKTLKGYVETGLIPEPVKRGGRALFYKQSDLTKFLSHGE